MTWIKSVTSFYEIYNALYTINNSVLYLMVISTRLDNSTTDPTPYLPRNNSIL